MSTMKIVEIRNLLEVELRKAVRKNGTVDTVRLLRDFKKSQAAAVEQSTDLLLDLALTKLVGDIRQRKRLSLLSEAQQALFADMPGLRQSFVLRNSRGQKIEKTLATMTVGELQEWLHTETLAQSRLAKHPSEANLLNLVAPFAESMETTIEEALMKAKAGRKPLKQETLL